jgi:hypothetical protein
MSFRIASPIVIAALLTLSAAHSQQPPAPSSSEKAPTTTEIVTGGAPILSSIPSAMTTIASYYKQSVYDPMDRKIGEIADESRLRPSRQFKRTEAGT